MSTFIPAAAGHEVLRLWWLPNGPGNVHDKRAIIAWECRQRRELSDIGRAAMDADHSAVLILHPDGTAEEPLVHTWGSPEVAIAGIRARLSGACRTAATED